MQSLRVLSTARRLAVISLAPFIAIVIAVVVLTWGASADTSEAATTGAAMSMSVAAGQAIPCPTTKVNGEICIPFGAKFDVIVSADAIPAGGYKGVQAWIQYGATGLVGKGASMLWPDGDPGFLVTNDTGTGAFAGAVTSFPSFPLSFHKGAIFSFSFTCTGLPSSHVLVLEPPGGPNAGLSGSGFSDGTTDTPATGPNLLVNCGPIVHKLPFPSDTDGDGCPDVNESLPSAEYQSGGGRDYLDRWDWYDVNQDGNIDLFTDILGVINHYSLDGSPPYDPIYDRGASAGPNPWNMTAPDGIIDLFVDILGVINQYSLTGCTVDPGP